MTLTGETPRAASIGRRVQNILLRPSQEWTVIAHEPATVRGLFTGYAMILAAIAPVCGLVGGVLFTMGTLSRMGIAISPIGFVVSALVNYAVALAAVFVFGLVIERLAPTFGATPDRLRAMKVAVYSGTAIWVVGVLALLPPVAFLMILGLYSIFLLYRGLPIVMGAPPEKATGYTTAVTAVMLVVWIVLAGLATMLTVGTGLSPNPFAMHPHVTSTTTTSVTHY